MKFCGSALAVAIAAATAAWCSAETGEPSERFESRGVIVDVHTFFTAATSGADSTVAIEQAEVAGRALVTEAGVFAFLETPQNAERLSGTEPGSVVHVQGKLLERGALLHVDKLSLVTTVPLIDFARLRTDPGRPVALKGVNKCQCGLADLETGIGGWDLATFIQKFRSFATESARSRVAGEGEPNTVMPWLMYAGMTDADLTAIYTYLRTVPPVESKVEMFPPPK